jgi:peroxiredoxin
MFRSRAIAAVVITTALSFAPAHAGQTPEPTLPSLPSPAPVDTPAPASGYAVVDAGSQAPDFSFESAQGWLQLSDVRAQGSVLLAFCPDDGQLAALEGERERLLTLGVVPVAVLDRRPNACRALARKLQLGFLLVPDVHREIGAQFNALDPFSRADAPAWFVIDQQGCVRELAHDSWPSRSWTETCAGALGLPAPDAARSASHGD